MERIAAVLIGAEEQQVLAPGPCAERLARLRVPATHRIACRSSLAFFHANPTGRILNRFCKDQTMLDVQLPLGLFEALQVRHCSRAPALGCA